MQPTGKLFAALTSAITSFRPVTVVETGTNIGTGSTKIILNCFPTDRPPVKFFTMEVSYQLFRKAQANLSAYDFITCLHGLSVPRDLAILHTAQNKFLSDLPAFARTLRIDYSPADYVNELNWGLEQHIGDPEGQDDLLSKVVPTVRSHRPLFCLDSAGSIGLLEFRLVCQLMSSTPFLLLLDDINHVKHYLTALLITDNPSWHVWGKDWEEGWLVAEYRP